MGQATITLSSGTMALILGIVNLLALIYFAGVKLGRLELKTDTMWDVVVKGAMVDARRSGVLQVNPHLRVSVKVATALQPLKPKLLPLYRRALSNGRGDSEIVLLFATHFMDELIEQV